MLDLLSVSYLSVGAVVFLAFGWGVKKHFRSEKMPVGMSIISVCSLAAFFSYIYEFAHNHTSLLSATLGASLQLAAAAIFVSSVKQTRQNRLSLAYDKDKPNFIVKSGPYNFVRHPFYTSYILDWVGCAVEARSLMVTVAAVVMFLLYLVAALKEEGKFERSELRNDYRSYRDRAGLFWPKFGQIR